MSAWLLGIMIALGLGAFIGAIYGVHRWLAIYDSERRQEEYKKEVRAFMQGYTGDTEFKKLIFREAQKIVDSSIFRNELVSELGQDDSFTREVRRTAKSTANDIIVREKDRLISFIETGLETLKQREDEFLQEMAHYRDVLRYIEQLYMIDEHDRILINMDLEIPYETKMTDEWGDEIIAVNHIRLCEIMKSFEDLQDYLSENSLGLEVA